MHPGLITLSFGESANLLALRFFDYELKKNSYQSEEPDMPENEVESNNDPSLFIGSERQTPNWLMFDFNENFDTLCSIMDEQESEEYDNDAGMDNIWESKITSSKKESLSHKSQQFNFLRTSNMIFRRKGMLTHKKMLMNDFG